MATYELLITSPTEIALNSTDGSVKEKLTLAKRPLDSSVLVQEARLDVLQTINLEELFKNLGVCAPLLNITYDAVNGTGYEIKDGKLSGGSLTTTVTELKDRFSKTIDRSITVMTGFKAGTESAVTGFLQAYDYLTDPDYVEEKINGVSMACKKFESIRGIAVDMHKDAVGLANTFAEIETTAQNVTKVIMTQRDMDNAKKEELTRTLNSLTTQIDAFSKVKESLDEEVAKYDKEYSKISNIIEKNSKQAFGLQLASAITSGACSLFSTVAGAFSTKAVVGSVINGAMNKDDKSPQQQQQGGATGGSVSSDPATKEELEKSNKTIADSGDRVAKIDVRLAELKSLIEKETDEAAKSKLLEEQDTLTKEKETKNNEIEAARKQAAIYEAAIKTAQEAAQKMEKMSQDLTDQSAKLYDSLDKIADQRAAVSKSRRDTMMKLATMTGELASATTSKRDLEVVLQALIMAIGCMRIVKVYLSDIALFWDNVEKFCKRLIAGVEAINEDAKSHEESKNYIKFFIKDTFIETYLVNLANWVALNVISVEYLDAFNKTRIAYQQIELTSKESDPQVHWKRAQDNARLLQEQLKIELL